MTVTWTAPGGVDTCTLSASATHTTSDICTTGSPPATASLVRTSGSCSFFELLDCRVVIEAGSTWEEKTALGSENTTVLYHRFSGTSAAVELQSATSVFDWGNKIGTSLTAPVTCKGHLYIIESFNKNADNHWFRHASTLGAGILRFYGGSIWGMDTLLYDTGDDNGAGGNPVAPFRITGDTSGATGLVDEHTVLTGTWAGADATGQMTLNEVVGVFQDNETVSIDGVDDDFIMNGLCGSPELYMPDDEVELLQTNWARCGGVKFGSDSTVLESKFKKSQDAGLSWLGDNTVQTMNKIQLHDFDVALDVSGNGEAIIKRLSIRGGTNDLKVTTFTGNLEVVDSKNIVSLDGTLDFDGGASTNYVREANSVNLRMVDSSGTALQNIRVQMIRDDTNELYGTDQLTNASGDIVERTANRFQLDADHLTVAAHLDFGSLRIRARDYGRVYHDPIVPLAEVGIAQTRTMIDNIFSIDGTGGQFDDDTAAAFTGVALVDGLTSGVSLTFNENSPSADTITRSSGSFVTDNWEDGMFVRVTGTASNDGIYQIDTVVALTITLISTDDLAAETVTCRLDGQQVTITSGTANTLNKVYSKVQSLLEKTANMKFQDMLETADGVGYVMPTATQIIGLDNIDFEGGFIVQQDGVKRFVPVKISNINSGANMSVDRVSDDVELGQKLSTGTTDTVVVEYSGTDELVNVRVRKGGSNVAFVQQVLLTSGGLNITAFFPVDDIVT